MGGSAFAALNPPLYTPRMPPVVYNYVLDQVQELLRQHYTNVGAAIEGPGKTTFGDVDVLVHGPLASPDENELPTEQLAESLAKILGAAKWIREKGNPTVNLALPWPEHLISEVCSQDEEVNVAGTKNYVQVDVHVCLTEKSFHWERFHAAHGDLWSILGTTIRRFGLTVNNKGLFLRIPEIELLDRKKSMVFLTDEPAEILDFLGLDEATWWKAFGNVQDMYKYAAGCRMFWVKDTASDNEVDGDVVGEVTQQIQGQEGGESGKKKLKHNDRQRMSKRPIFKQWIDEFIPQCRQQGRFLDNKLTREQVRDEAFEKFGVKNDYQNRLRDWKVLRNQDEVLRDGIKGLVPIDAVDPQIRAAAIRTLRPVITGDDLFDGVKPEAAFRDDEGLYDLAAVKEFVRNNWVRAGEIGMARLKAVQAKKQSG